ncbi:hypothetical protein GCM10008983_10060 [Lentibacillus halophilus]|uniref:Uncharacterized protein n=1 Tax=Lentibacillus halophilus TaxID=295065 RepID=A0ABP3J0C7_9BACI
MSKERKDQVNRYLQSNTGFTFPISQEKKRTEIEKTKVEKDILRGILNEMNMREDTLETESDGQFASVGTKVKSLFLYCLL